MSEHSTADENLTRLRDCWACGTGMDFDQKPPKCLACGADDPCGDGPERFKQHPLDMQGFVAEIIAAKADEQEYCILREIGTEGDLRLFVREARALRDWLDSVVP